MIKSDDIRKQSEAAYRQWAPQWREHAKIHSKYEMKSLSDFEYSGVGKGYSTEVEIETIQKYQENVDIICCDKSLGHLLDHGIKPKFCMVADANVSYEKYLSKWKDELQDTILIMNVAGNPKWTELGNWKDRYFITVMDVLKSEKEFMALSGCTNVIAAGTNVSNGLVIFLTQCDNSGRKNFFAYDKILLIGFDYSWKTTKKYYAFDAEGSGKSNYMRHCYLLDLNRDLCCSSNNLLFSAQWLNQYINSFKLPVIQCTRETVLVTKNVGVLADQMQYSHRKEDSKTVKNLFKLRRLLVEQKTQIDKSLAEMSRDHYYSFIASL
jgi:hypothetical protein